MTVLTKPNIKNLGDYAYSAIKKHFKKASQWETTVKKDKDPEALHQMRVGMRRLRTAVNGFTPVVTLPKSASDKKIGKISRRLGNLRDLDVMKEALETVYQPQLPSQEQKTLQTAFEILSQQREDALVSVRTTLKDERYKSLKHKLQEWLDKPHYQPLASMPLQQVLPDLLLPEVSCFLLHPGWLVGTETADEEIIVSQDWDATKIDQQLKNHGETLHSLRKQAKRLRYQMELFTNCYDEAYSAHVTQVKSVQDILGSIQDTTVLMEWLIDIFKLDLDSQLPTLVSLLAKNRYQLWQQWQPLQKSFLQTETRQGLHLTVLRPN